MSFLLILAVASGLAYLLLDGKKQPSASKPAGPDGVPPPTPEVVAKTTEVLPLASGGTVQAFNEPMRDAIMANLGYCSLVKGPELASQSQPALQFWVLQPGRPGATPARDTVLAMYAKGFATIGTLANIMPLTVGRLIAFVLPEELGQYAAKGSQWAVLVAPAGTFAGTPAQPVADSLSSDTGQQASTTATRTSVQADQQERAWAQWRTASQTSQASGDTWRPTTWDWNR